MKYISDTQAVVITTLAIIFFCLIMLAGCASSTSTVVRQLAKQGEFEKIEVTTRQGTRVKVKYRDIADDRWME